MSRRSSVRVPYLPIGLTALAVSLLSSHIDAQSPAPGGFIERATDTDVRPMLTPAQIQSLLPARGLFTFPSPYLTQGVRITNASDCGGADCVWYVGYSYWRNMNNHVGSDAIVGAVRDGERPARIDGGRARCGREYQNVEPRVGDRDRPPAELGMSASSRCRALEQR